jgi:hypothetical protein
MRVVNITPMSRTLGPSTIQTFSANAEGSYICVPFTVYQAANDG